jgi:hypothetical protein
VAKRRVWLVYDWSDPLADYEKLVCAPHSSLENAISQAEVDLAAGVTVVGIFDAPLRVAGDANELREVEGNRLWPE